MTLQDFLDQEARLANSGYANSYQRKVAHEEIKKLRGDEPPPCWGEDDCSTTMLMHCPWRIDCD